MSTLAKTLSLISALFMLTACGGGGSSVSRDNTDNGSGDGGTTSPTYSIALTLENESGASDNSLSEDNSLFVVATVSDQDGNPHADALLTFTLSNEQLAEFGNDTGTARTNSNGVARLRLNASTASGDGEITAALGSGETGTTTFSATAVTSTDPTTISVSLALQNADGEADNSLSSSNALVALATVTNSEGEPQADLLLTFSLSNDDLATFSNDTATALTNAEGVASIGMSVGSASGDGEVTATLPTGEADSTTFSSEGSTTVSEEPASLDLFASSILLPSSGNDQIELIALVKNAQSVLMEGVDVSFFAENEDGLQIQLSQPVTAEDGTARAFVSTRNNAMNRPAEVFAQAGSLPAEKILIEISGTEVTANGPSSVILNSTAEFTLRVQDSDGNPLGNESIIIEPGTGTFDNTAVTTGANGQVSVTYTAVQSGTDSFNVRALGALTVVTIQVQQDEFDFDNIPQSEIPLNTPTLVSVQWLKDNLPVVGQEVTFSISRGEFVNGSTSTTDSNGVAQVSIQADNAGIASLTATGLDSSDGSSVSAVEEVAFIAVVPATIIADATPDIIGPDGQTSTITAIVRDPSGNLVKDQVINFNVNDTSTGFISPSQSRTDSNGVASTVFTSGSTSSEDAVIISAEVASNPSIRDTVNMTVGSRPFDISIGTGNTLEEPDTETYLKRFAVFVSDSAGRPVSGVSLTASATPVKRTEPDNRGIYLKGRWNWNEDRSIWEPIVTAVCQNEDANSNGILDAGEDTNGDTFLTPGIVGTISVGGNGVTDINGQAELIYRYPASYGYWYDTVITIFGQSNGSESSADHFYRLGVSSEDLTNEGAGLPANPFGMSNSCTDFD